MISLLACLERGGAFAYTSTHFPGRSDEDTFTKATCELYCSFLPCKCFPLISLVPFLVFTVWYLLLGGCCRAQEARRSRAFITATHLHYRRKRYTCGCFGGGEDVVSVPLLNVVDILTDETWWLRIEAATGTCGGCTARPCCAKKVPNHGCMLLGVLHRPSTAIDPRALGKPVCELVELTALEDPTTFRQVLRAAVALRQKGYDALSAGFNGVLEEAVSAGVSPGSSEEQQASAAMMTVRHSALSGTLSRLRYEASTCSRRHYPDVLLGIVTALVLMRQEQRGYRTHGKRSHQEDLMTNMQQVQQQLQQMQRTAVDATTLHSLHPRPAPQHQGASIEGGAGECSPGQAPQHSPP